MSNGETQISRIEQIVAEIERLDQLTGGRFRQAEDREAFDIAARIERKMAQSVGNVSRETLNGDAV